MIEAKPGDAAVERAAIMVMIVSKACLLQGRERAAMMSLSELVRDGEHLSRIVLDQRTRRLTPSSGTATNQ